MKIIDGKAVSANLKTKIANIVQAEYINNNKKAPSLVCILVGDDPASKVYVANKEKACHAVGINSIVVKLPSTSTKEEIKQVINKYNADNSVAGILLQLPLPKSIAIYENELIDCISPLKDVDGLTKINLGKLVSATQQIAPCTATGIIDLLDAYNIDISGKKVAVVGRSLLVGKSVAHLLEQRNATVVLCHSKTQNLESITKHADILVVAIGKPKYITRAHVKQNAVVIDVGINRLETGLIGDVDFDSVATKCSYITPVPGGVGPMTIAELLRNTIILDKLQTKIIDEQNCSK